MDNILDTLTDELFDIIIKLFQTVFGWCSDTIEKLWSSIFNGAESLGSTCVSLISSIVSKVNFDNYLLIFLGVWICFIIVRVTFHVISIIRG